MRVGVSDGSGVRGRVSVAMIVGAAVGDGVAVSAGLRVGVTLGVGVPVGRGLAVGFGTAVAVGLGAAKVGKKGVGNGMRGLGGTGVETPWAKSGGA